MVMLERPVSEPIMKILDCMVVVAIAESLRLPYAPSLYPTAQYVLGFL